MRNMSFFLTTSQFLDGSKDVTRRLGWKSLKKGDRVMAVEKGQGIKKGGLVRLGVIEVVHVRRELLSRLETDPAYGMSEAVREGFPSMDGRAFVGMFCEHNGCLPGHEVTRIQFQRVPA